MKLLPAISLLYLTSVVNAGPGPIAFRPDHHWPAGNCAQCCDGLRHLLGRKISYPGDLVYEAEQTGLVNSAGYWSLQESDLRPSCRVTPTRAEDVATAVRFMARSRCLFAVRGGGHTSYEGAANIGSEGITIDLSALNSVTLTPDRSIARIGGGARWQDVYLALDAQNLGVAGGRVAQVGVGGLTLGGGKSFFQTLYGFACDNVASFQIVTASGSILEASDSAYPDLFKALKGGSGNFGVVTRFSLKTFRQGKLWAGQNIYPPTTEAQQYQALYNFTNLNRTATNATGDVQIIAAYVNSGGGRTFFANFYSNTHPQAWPSELGGFQAITPSLYSTNRVANLTDFALELGVGTPNNLRYIFGTATFRNNLAFLSAVRSQCDGIFAPLFARHIGQLQVSLVFQPLTAAMLDSGCGKNSLGLCPSDGNLMILDLTVQWNSSSDDVEVNRAARRLIDWTNSQARQRGIWSEYIYLNYALEGTNPFKSYGEDNYRFLRNTARKYDPKRVFQTLVPGGFKLDAA